MQILDQGNRIRSKSKSEWKIEVDREREREKLTVTENDVIATLWKDEELWDHGSGRCCTALSSAVPSVMAVLRASNEDDNSILFVINGIYIFFGQV